MVLITEVEKCNDQQNDKDHPCKTATPLLGIDQKSNQIQLTLEIPAHPAFLFPSSQPPSYGVSQGAHQQMNGFGKYGLCTQWLPIQLQRRAKFYHLQESGQKHRFRLGEISQSQSQRCHPFPSHFKSRETTGTLKQTHQCYWKYGMGK